MKNLLRKLAIWYLKRIGYETDFLWQLDDVRIQADDYDRMHGTITELTRDEAEQILYEAVNRSMCGINDEILALIGDRYV